MTTIQQAILKAHELIDSRIECDVLLSFALHKSRTYLYTHPETTLLEDEYSTFQKLIQKRTSGIPIAYLTGEREFWSLPLKVTPDTLIPRPETEMLVELTLKSIDPKQNAHILDCGTGAGGIAIALAKERPNWRISACDQSAAAIAVAQENADRLGCKNIQFFISDWFSNLPKSTLYDAIVSNPPYIASDDPHTEQGDLRFEPQSALVSGQDGLDAIRKIIEQSLARLEKNGLLLLEHGYNQKNAVSALLNKSGYLSIQCWQDWQGHDRISGGRRIAVEE